MKEEDMETASGVYVGGESYVQGFGVEHEVKSSFGRPRYRWEKNIKNKSSTGRGSWIGLSWFRMEIYGGVL
jgi:hypothetical protein